MFEWRFLLDENIDPKILPYLREHDLVLATSDVTDFGALSNEIHACLILLYDDTMAAYRVASALIAMVDAYPDRDVFAGREELDSWA
ncbi:MAG: hypothetical protein ABEI76_01860 [Halobacteriales archaeon]